MPEPGGPLSIHLTALDPKRSNHNTDKAPLTREDSNTTLVDHSLSHTMSTLKKAVSKVHHTIHPHHRNSSQSRGSNPSTPTSILSPTTTIHNGSDTPASSIAFPGSATQSITSPVGSGTHTPVDNDRIPNHAVTPNTAAQRQQGRSRSVDVKRSKSKSRHGSDNVASPRRAQSRPARGGGGRGRERTLSFTEERAKRDANKEIENARQAEERKRKAKAAHDSVSLSYPMGRRRPWS